MVLSSVIVAEYEQYAGNAHRPVIPGERVTGLVQVEAGDDNEKENSAPEGIRATERVSPQRRSSRESLAHVSFLSFSVRNTCIPSHHGTASSS